MDNDHFKSSGFSRLSPGARSTGVGVPTMIFSFLCLSALCQLGTR